VIQGINNVFDDLLNFPQVPNPALILLSVANNRDGACKAMSMDFLKNVIGINVAKIMRRLELEIFLDLKAHEFNGSRQVR
jgi:hypothetical protein